MSQPLVSVAMTTYNHAPYIAQAIEGVLKQKTNLSFELVIGEDCSTDGTREIVFEYQQRYPDVIRVITSNENVGMKENGRRVGEACRGKYLAYCEGDDYWHHPEKLHKQVEYMENHKECGMVFSDCDEIDIKTKRVTRNKTYASWYQYRSPSAINIEQILDLNMMKPTCTVMARRDLVEKIIESDPYLHQSGHFLMGDTPLWAELSLISQVSYIPESLATYRLLEESASHSKDLKTTLRFWMSAAEMRLYLCDKHDLPEDIREKAELLFYDKALQLAFHDRNPTLAAEIKRKKRALTLKEWLRYYGAKYIAFNYTYRVLAMLSNIFKGASGC